MIYILEDDDSIRKLVTYALESQGYRAEGFAIPSAFYDAMKEKIPSLLLLDIMLPEEDGISILKKLRRNPRTAQLPVIMLTAKSTEYDHVEGLDAGADDYVAKPFGMMELLARVRAVLRRAESMNSAGSGSASPGAGAERSALKGADGMTAGAGTFSGAAFQRDTAAGVSGVPSSEASAFAAGGSERIRSDTVSAGTEQPHTMSLRRRDLLEYGILRIYPKRYEVYVGENEISLTNKEYQLLLLLVENEGIVLTREILLDRIWDLGLEPENRTLDVHIRKIRSKLGDAAAWIETIRGVGYRFHPVKNDPAPEMTNR